MAAKGSVRFAIACAVIAASACRSFGADAPESVPVDAGPEAAALETGTPPPPFDAGVDPPFDAGDSGPPGPIIFGGAVDRILLSGLVVTPDAVHDGEVLVEGSTITCVGAGGECGALPSAAGATLVLTNGIIAPGMIDMHNHVLFGVFDESDWSPSKAYTHHDEWTSEPRYQALLAAKQSVASSR